MNTIFFIVTYSGNHITQLPLVHLLWLFSQNDTFKDLKKNLSLYLLLLIYHLKHLNAFAVNISPKTFKHCVDDSHVRFENKQKSFQFLQILNKQDSSIQYTIEFENNQKQLNFLDITITNNRTNSYDFKILRKPAITNVQIKSNSNMALNVSVSVFKGFLSRAYKICSERYIDEEIPFLIDVFKENGYERKILEKIKNYLNELQNPPVNKRTLVKISVK